MIIKKGFMLRKVAGNNIVVAVGEASKNFNGIITLNDTGAFLFDKLKKDISKEDLLKALLKEYDIDEETAKKDIDLFIEKLEANKILK